MLKLNTLKESMDFTQLKSINLLKSLRGTQYSTKIQQFFEFDLAVKNLKKDLINCSVIILSVSFRQLWLL